MDKTAITRLLRINWRTVGAIIERVVADELDPHRLDDLYEIGIDEVSYRKQHHYLTIVACHRSGKVVWAEAGKDTAAARRFYNALGKRRSEQLTAVSMDMGKAYPKVTPNRRCGGVACVALFRRSVGGEVAEGVLGVGDGPGVAVALDLAGGSAPGAPQLVFLG